MEWSIGSPGRIVGGVVIRTRIFMSRPLSTELDRVLGKPVLCDNPARLQADGRLDGRSLDRSSVSVLRRPVPYGAGLLRYMQKAGIEVLEVTTPDKHDRRKRGKSDDLDAQNAAHAAALPASAPSRPKAATA